MAALVGEKVVEMRCVQEGIHSNPGCDGRVGKSSWQKGKRKRPSALRHFQTGFPIKVPCLFLADLIRRTMQVYKQANVNRFVSVPSTFELIQVLFHFSRPKRDGSEVD